MEYTAEDFRRELDALLAQCRILRLQAVDVNAGDLYRRVAGRTVPGDAMGRCCEALIGAMGPDDEILARAEPGAEDAVVVRFRLRR